MMKHFLLDTKNREKSAYIWNTSSAMLSSFQTVFILMVISRIDPIEDAGVFTIAFAIGNLMMAIGKYGMRQFQVSDMSNKYSFREYLYSRMASNILMAVICIGYLGYYLLRGAYSGEKAAVIGFVCLTKMVDSAEDIYHGEFQKKARLDVAGKILTIRLAVYIFIYVFVYFNTGNLLGASIGSFLVSLVICIFFNRTASLLLIQEKSKIQKKRVVSLLKECFPLVVSSFLVMYIGNAPKYALDTVLSSQEQACFGFVFMPVFVISLLSQFIYQPIIYRLASMRNNGKIKELKGQVIRQIYIIGGLTIVTIIAGKMLGIRVLSIIYGIDLHEYEKILLILLAGGGILSCVNFFQVIITIFRKQAILAKGYAVSFIIFSFFGKVIVKNYGTIGISIFYVLVILGIMLIFGGQVVKCFRREIAHEK